MPFKERKVLQNVLFCQILFNELSDIFDERLFSVGNAFLHFFMQIFGNVY